MCKTKDTDTNKDQNLDKTPKNKNNQKVSDKFFWFVLILTVIFALAQVYNCCKAKERQDRILEVLLDSETTLKSQNTSIIDYSDSSVVDSNFLNKRNSLQSSKKDTIVFLEKENKDPELNTSPNITSTIENIEKLLHLEIAKIEEERTSLTLWIGIITVVFLIFSFYSMLKSDDLVRQSRENLDEIKETSKKCEEQFANLDTKFEEKIKKYKTEFDGLQKNCQEKINQLEKNCQEKIDQLEKNCQEKIDQTVEDVLSCLKENISSENQGSTDCHSSENHCEEDDENYLLIKKEEVQNSTTQE